MSNLDKLVEALKDGYEVEYINIALDDAEHIEGNIYDTSRWSNWFRHIVRVGEDHFEVIVEHPATEQQECEGYTSVTQVEPHETTVVVFKKIPGAKNVDFFTG